MPVYLGSDKANITLQQVLNDMEEVKIEVVEVKTEVVEVKSEVQEVKCTPFVLYRLRWRG
jgi:hypothetical protein